MVLNCLEKFKALQLAVKALNNMTPPHFSRLYIYSILVNRQSSSQQWSVCQGSGLARVAKGNKLQSVLSQRSQWKWIKLKRSQSGRRETRRVWCPKRHMKSVSRREWSTTSNTAERYQDKWGLQIDPWNLATWINHMVTLTRMVSVEWWGRKLVMGSRGKQR